MRLGKITKLVMSTDCEISKRNGYASSEASVRAEAQVMPCPFFAADSALSVRSSIRVAAEVFILSMRLR